MRAQKSPQIEGYSSETWKSRFVSDCVVADAVDIEPVSSDAVSVYREKYSDLCGFAGLEEVPRAKNAQFTDPASRIA